MTTYTLGASAAAILGVSLTPVSDLHSVPLDVAATWIAKIDLFDKMVTSDKQTVREGVITFHIARVPTNLVEVRVKVFELTKFGDSELWLGKLVACSAKDWLWSYSLDWRTGKKIEPQVNRDIYPFAHIKGSL